MEFVWIPENIMHQAPGLLFEQMAKQNAQERIIYLHVRSVLHVKQATRSPSKLRTRMKSVSKVTIRPVFSRTVLYFWVLSWISLCPGFVLDLKSSLENAYRSSNRLENHEICQLILRNVIKIVATKCQISRLKCTKFDFGWGSAPDPAGGAYSASPGCPLDGFELSNVN